MRYTSQIILIGLLTLGGCIFSSENEGGPVNPATSLETYKTADTALYAKGINEVLNSAGNSEVLYIEFNPVFFSFSDVIGYSSIYDSIGNGIYMHDTSYSELKNYSVDTSYDSTLYIFKGLNVSDEKATNGITVQVLDKITQTVQLTVTPDAIRNPTVIDNEAVTVSRSFKSTTDHQCLTTDIPADLSCISAENDYTYSVATAYNLTFGAGKVNGTKAATASSKGKTLSGTITYQDLGYTSADLSGTVKIEEFADVIQESAFSNIGTMSYCERESVEDDAVAYFSFTTTITFDTDGNVTSGTVTSGSETIGTITGDRSDITATDASGKVINTDKLNQQLNRFSPKSVFDLIKK